VCNVCLLVVVVAAAVVAAVVVVVVILHLPRTSNLGPPASEIGPLTLFALLELCMSSVRRGHANLPCIVPILTDDPRRES